MSEHVREGNTFMNIEDSHKDLRVRLTHQMLIEAFLQLRREKPLRKITVRELCERAGVGRGTFYAHFLDVYDLNEKLEMHLLNEFTQMLKETLEQSDATASVRRVCRTVFALLEKNEQVCRLLLSADNAEGVARFVEMGRQLCMEYYARYFTNTSQEKVAQYYRFVSSGCIACLQARLAQESRPPVEQFADEMSEIILKGTRCLL